MIGEVPNVEVGQPFDSRRLAHEAGVHRPLQAGICGTKKSGAESIVVSGGYKDDEDYGNVIVYTGHGGQDSSKNQVSDQTVEDAGNAALVTSHMEGLPSVCFEGHTRAPSTRRPRATGTTGCTASPATAASWALTASSSGSSDLRRTRTPLPRKPCSRSFRNSPRVVPYPPRGSRRRGRKVLSASPPACSASFGARQSLGRSRSGTREPARSAA